MSVDQIPELVARADDLLLGIMYISVVTMVVLLGALPLQRDCKETNIYE